MRYDDCPLCEQRVFYEPLGLIHHIMSRHLYPEVDPHTMSSFLGTTTGCFCFCSNYTNSAAQRRHWDEVGGLAVHLSEFLLGLIRRPVFSNKVLTNIVRGVSEGVWDE